MDSQISIVAFLGKSGMSMIRVHVLEACVNEKMKQFLFYLSNTCSIIFQKLMRRTETAPFT